MDHEHCFCGSGKAFAACCGPILDGSVVARTPEELMRARYTAHCRRDYSFLVASSHPDHRHEVSEEKIAQWAAHVHWTGLTVHSATPGASENDGEVAFTAHYTVKDTPQELREDARFARVEGTWFYVDGRMHGPEPYRRDEPRPGRNDPCPCGSVKKFKKCCGKL